MILELLLVVFVASQSVYAVINLIALVAIYPYPTRYVTRETPEEYEDLNVLVPLRGESREVFEGTFEDILDAEYPVDRTNVYAIFESDDSVVREYVDEFDVTSVPVEVDDRLWQQITASPTARTPLSPRKGRALTYALYKLELQGVITVLDSDTEFEPDLFRRGVAGLEEYDITQAKQTVWNTSDGLLPLWESMGIAAWSHAIYAKTARGPYQLLGKGYFISTETLYDLHGWDPTDPTEDMALGIEAYKRGYKLGIIDSYLQDICPSRFSQWVRQKRRWVGGPYRVLSRSTLSLRDSLRFGSTTAINQLMSVNHLFGVPAGLAVFLLFVVGAGPAVTPALAVLLGFNLLMWVYFTFRTYQATEAAVRFRSTGHKIKYYILSNPITQIVYSLLWVVPIFLFLFGSRTRRDEFIVTPKEIRNRVTKFRKNSQGEGDGTPVVDSSDGPSAAVFELYADRASEWRWRLIHSNGNIIADSGEGYDRKAGALNGLESVRRTGEEDSVQNLEEGDESAETIVGTDGSAFELYRDKASEWRWRLVHNNGNITADSAEGYERKAGAENGLESVRSNAQGAYIVGLPAESDSVAPTEVNTTRSESEETDMGEERSRPT